MLKYPWLLYTQSVCASIALKRYPRRVAQGLQNTTSGPPAKGLLKFNLSGYRYCGPGTDVEKADDAGGPINLLDSACRDHDVEYLVCTNPIDADGRLLQKVWNLRSEMLPLFIAVFEAKRYFEEYVGKEYTSSLYYLPPGSSPSLTLYFVDKTSYEGMNTTSSSIRDGMHLEEKWKAIVTNIWQGNCYSKVLNVIELPEPMDSGKGQSSKQRSQLPSSSGTAGPTPDTSKPDEDTTDQEIPPITSPTPFSPCKVVISEVAFQNTANTISFIELQKLCPPKFRSLATSLTGYILVRLTSGDTMLQSMYVNMQKQKLRAVTEGTTLRKVTNNYFVVGVDLPNSDFDLQNGQVVRSGTYIGFSRAGEIANALLLLYVPPSDMTRVSNALRLPSGGRQGQFRPSIVTEENENLIRQYVQDIIVYGPPCTTDDCRFFSEIIQVRQQVVTPANVYLPVPEVQSDESGSIPYKSINRCTTSILPMQINDWMEGYPTPAARNNCPNTNPLSLPFRFGGKPMQSTAQHIVVNLYTFFQKASVDDDLLRGSPAVVTSRATTLGDSTLTSILNSYRQGTISTPGKRKLNPHFPIQGQFDEFHYDMIRRIVQDCYNRYTPPFIRDVRNTFLNQVEAENENKRRRGETVPVFSCGLDTFRKILKKIGFVFGKIGIRDAVLQRPDIAKRRGEYLRAMKRNEQSPNPLPVVYTDETWIDPHARTGKGWVPKSPSGPEERLKYTYRKHKASRGPKLIVLNAGGADGYIDGAMKVYPVNKKDATGDYHDNVDAEAYTEWFINLLEILSCTGPHLIVIDNAPYHSVSVAPKERERKGVLYDFLKKNLEPERLELLEPEKNYRKWELWEMVLQLKKRKNFYKVDQVAEQMGHQLIRLPPYNCDLNPIELCWKDLKHELRKTNLDQNINTVQKNAEDFMRNYGSDLWKRHIGHVKRLGETYWKEDGLYDDMLDRQTQLIIPLNEDDTDDEEDGEDQELDGTESVISSAVHDLDDIND